MQVKQYWIEKDFSNENFRDVRILIVTDELLTYSTLTNHKKHKLGF